MKNDIKYLALIAFIFIVSNIKAQNSVDNILSEIAKNNKSLIANQQYWEAKKLQYKTGLTL